jgi:hypothetical protein
VVYDCRSGGLTTGIFVYVERGEFKGGHTWQTMIPFITEDRMSNQELLMEEHRRWVEGLEQP